MGGRVSVSLNVTQWKKSYGIASEGRDKEGNTLDEHRDRRCKAGQSCWEGLMQEGILFLIYRRCKGGQPDLGDGIHIN
jgi:hypothetical protein